MTLGRVVVMPVASPVTAAMLGGLAARIAAPDEGFVVPVSVVPHDAAPDVVADAQTAIARAEQAVRDAGAQARGRVVRNDSVVDGVLDAIAEDAATLALMGWQGTSTRHNVFGFLIDSIVGRAQVPLAIVRPGPETIDRVVLTLSQEHLLPAGVRGVSLAGSIADRLRTASGAGVLLLRTGNPDRAVPEEIRGLSQTVHHDPRPADVAVRDAARDTDIVITPVAPTLEGLRSATTHMAWAIPRSWLLVAIDVGPPPEVDVAPAVDNAGMIVPTQPEFGDEGPHRVRVTVRPADDISVIWDDIESALRLVGAVTDHRRWTDDDGRECHSGQVEIIAPTSGSAVAAAMMALDHARERLGPSEISYAIIDAR